MQLNLLDNPQFDSLKTLEWPSIIQELKKNCHFESSHEFLDEPVLTKPWIEIQLDYQSLAFFVQLSWTEDFHELKNILTQVQAKKSLKQTMERLTKSAVLELTEINQVVKVYEAFDKMLPILKNWSKLADFFNSRDEHQNIKRHVIRPIRQIISPDGEINYRNHPELGRLYEKQLELETRIRHTLNTLAQDPLYSERLQFSGHDIINERYVVAIRTDSYKAELGPIISRSETGMTLYVEPYAIKSLVSERMNILSKMAEILNLLCLQYSKLLESHIRLFVAYFSALIDIDLNLSKAEFSNHHHLVEPKLSNDGSFQIYGLFHPLIKNPVKNDLIIDANYSGLVISGPNTGGKTATLKALTLCHLFMHFGLYVPATEATLPLMDGIFYLGNDGQDLNQGLSSFSSEVKSYIQLFTEFKENNLIVIDEIFNSTSSEEASALAIALFEEIRKNANAKIIISTHHQMLKTFMHSDQKFLSGHVGFDVIHHRPNYKLYIGMPGSSMALSIFKNLSDKSPIETNIVERATNILEKKLVLYESLLQDVARKQNELDRLIHENHEMNLELKNQIKSQEGILKLKMQDKLSEYEEKVQITLKQAEQLLHKVQLGEINKRKQLENKSFELQAELRTFQPNESKPQIQKALRPKEYKDGERYYLPMLDRNVELKSHNLKKNEAMVLNGKISIRCKLDDLFVFQANKSFKPILGGQVKVHIERGSNISHNYDCRGMRLDEFENLMEKAISSLILGEVPFIHVVHGHGDGILKNWLRKYLKGFPNLSYEIPEHSHDGATRINLVTN